MAERIPNVPKKPQFDEILRSDNSIYYILEIEGVAIFPVNAISGLGIETQVVEFTDGDNPLTHKRPGRFTYNNITVHNIPITKDLPIYDWVEITRHATDTSYRKTMSIIMMVDGKEVNRWNCFNCFPASFVYHPMETEAALYADMTIAVEWFEDA